MAQPKTTSRSKIIGAGAVVVLAAAAVLICRSLWPAQERSGPARAYFTTDEGASLFVDRIDRLPPFEHEGQPALRAHVFSCDGNQTRFVGYLEKADLESAKLREQAVARGESPLEFPDNGPFVKRAGGQNTRWFTPKDGKAYADVITVTPPDGAAQNLQEVLP